jgi:hypothetical protein
MNEQWFAFRAYNSQALYGYGTEEQAEAYVDDLNRQLRRDVNVYGAYALSDDESRGLEENTEAFNLDDEIEARGLDDNDKY